MTTSPTVSSTQQIPATAVGLQLHGNVKSVAKLWAFALAWNLFITGFYFLSHRDPAHSPPFWPFAPFFCLGGVVVLLAIYVTISRRRFGPSTFELQSAAAVPGGLITGMVRIPKPMIVRVGVHLRLACVRGDIVTFADNDTQVQENVVLWEEHRMLDRFAPGAEVSEIPVYFRIPRDAKLSDQTQSAGRIFWRLDVKAKTSGINYFASFVVPVVVGQVPQNLATISDPAASMQSPQPARRQAMDQHIHFTPLAGGGCQCELTAARGKLPAFIFAILGIFFLAVGVILFVSRAHGPDFLGTAFGAIGIIYAIISILPGAFCIGLAAWILLEQATIVIRRGSLSVHTKVLMINRQHQLRAADVQDITMKIEGQVNDHPLYSIEAIRPKDKPLRLCGLIREKGDAQWLAEEFKKSLFQK